MISVHLYGELRQYGQQPRPDRDTVVKLAASSNATVGTLLEQMGISPDDVAQIFLNGKLLKAGSSMAPWLGYQIPQDRLSPTGDHLDTLVQSGDRLGLFPRNMAMLVV